MNNSGMCVRGNEPGLFLNEEELVKASGNYQGSTDMFIKRHAHASPILYNVTNDQIRNKLIRCDRNTYLVGVS